MRQIRWIAAALLITAILLSGCSGRDMANDGMVDDSVVEDGMTNHNGKGGILSDIADDMEDGIDRIKDGMDTVEDDVRTDLGRNGGSANGSGSMNGN